MRLLIFYSFKNLLRYKNRYIITGVLFFFAVCIGSFSFILTSSCSRAIDVINNDLRNRYTLSVYNGKHNYEDIVNLPDVSKETIVKYMSLPSADKVILTTINSIALSDVYVKSKNLSNEEQYEIRNKPFIMEGYNSYDLYDIDEFKFGINVLKEGRMFEGNNEVIINDEIAYINNFKLGSKVYVNDYISSEDHASKFELTIVGIYSVKNDIYDFSTNIPLRSIRPSLIKSDIRNIIYTNFDTAYNSRYGYVSEMDSVVYHIEDHTGNEFFYYYPIIYADSNSLNDINNELHNNGCNQLIKLSPDSLTGNKLNAKMEVLRINLAITWFISLFVSSIILIVILFVNLKMRRTEYAVLCVMGMSKLKLLLFMSCEIMFFILIIFTTSILASRLFAHEILYLFYPAHIINWFNVSITFDIYFVRAYFLVLAVAVLLVIMFFMLYFLRFSLRKLLSSQD